MRGLARAGGLLERVGHRDQLRLAPRTPSITVPAGDSHGLPLGLTFMGRAWSEPQLIAMAYAFEQATRARKPPQYIPTLEP